MSLDRVLALTWRNFATLFLIVALVTVPLHVARTFIYRKVLVVREFEPDIQKFAPGREVRGIGPEDLDASRRSLLIVTAVELALLPLAVGAVRRVLRADGSGSVPSVADSWAHSVRELLRRAPGAPPTIPALAGAAAVGVIAGVLLERIGLLLSEPVPLYLSFAPIGVTEGVSRAIGAIFFLVPLALLGARPKVISPASRPNS